MSGATPMWQQSDLRKLWAEVRKPKPRKPRGPNGPRPEDRYSALGLLNIVNLLGCWDRAKPKGER